jgi:LmbE family N-acetylglucosaminyl deacetylase
VSEAAGGRDRPRDAGREVPGPEQDVRGGGGRPGVDLAVPARALAVAAHPDDVEFGCGATLAKWAEAGTVVHHLVCTDGSKGTWDPDADLAALVALRQEEQRAAARALGATGEVVFLGWADGELASDVRQRWQVAYHIRRLRPDVVLGHDPWQRYRLHPDHRHAGFLTVDGVVAARDPHFFPEQAIAHHRPAALLLFEADEPDHVEVVTEAHVARKLAALEAHRSQFRSTMHVEEGSADGESQLSAFRDRVRGRLVEHGALAGVPYGEAFKAITEL